MDVASCAIDNGYGVLFDDKRNTPFTFIICDKDGKTGYRFEDFCDDEEVNGIIQKYDLVGAVIIRTWKPGRSDEWISRDNEQYKRDHLNLRSISIESFFNQYFGAEEYKSFTSHVERYLQEARDITGYRSIKFLSSMNLATQKVYEEKELAEWDYQNYTTQEEFAYDYGTDIRTVSRYVNQGINKIDIVQELAEFFGVDFASFFTESSEPR